MSSLEIKLKDEVKKYAEFHRKIFQNSSDQDFIVVDDWCDEFSQRYKK